MQFYADSVMYHGTLHQSDRSLPTLLMLHGFMGSEKVFDPLIERLCTFCNPLTLDLAGHGQTRNAARPELFLAERQTAQIASIIKRVRLSPLFLYGYSMGGRLAFHLLANQANLFAGAIIESSHCGIRAENERTKRRETDRERASAIKNNFRSFLEEWQTLPLFTGSTGDTVQHYAAIMRSQNPQQMEASLRGFGAGMMPYACNRLTSCHTPVRLIAGEKDKKYVSVMTKIAEDLPCCHLQVVEHAGHRVHIDRPDALSRILNEHLTQF